MGLAADPEASVKFVQNAKNARYEALMKSKGIDIHAKKEEEEDMLDLAVGLTKTSRLSCQIDVTEILEGAEVLIPGDNY